MKSLQVGTYVNIDLHTDTKYMIVEKGLYDGTIESARSLCITKQFECIEQSFDNTSETYNKFAQDFDIHWIFGKESSQNKHLSDSYTECMIFGKYYWIRVRLFNI